MKDGLTSFLQSRVMNGLPQKKGVDLARRGVRTAHEIFNETGRYLGRGVSMLANSLNPEKIIIGGGISLAGELLLDPIIKEFNDNTMDIVKKNTEICLSSHGMDAGVRGAIAMALNDIVFNSDLVSKHNYL